MELNTFSIAARCPRTGQLGVAVASAVPAVGGLCPYIRAGIGAVTTQSWVNPYLAARILDGLAGGQATRRGPRGGARHRRPAGPAPARAGRRARRRPPPGPAPAARRWPATAPEPDYAVQGNMLAAPGVIDAMAVAFEDSAACDLDERLMRVLEAGDAAGGDRRGKQSAALRIVAGEDYPLLDLRVDEHAEPVAELRRVLEVARRQLVPFVAGMPRQGRAGRRAAGRRRGDAARSRPASGRARRPRAPPTCCSDVVGLHQEAARGSRTCWRSSRRCSPRSRMLRRPRSRARSIRRSSSTRACRTAGCPMTDRHD